MTRPQEPVPSVHRYPPAPLLRHPAGGAFTDIPGPVLGLSLGAAWPAAERFVRYGAAVGFVAAAVVHAGGARAAAWESCAVSSDDPGGDRDRRLRWPAAGSPGDRSERDRRQLSVHAAAFPVGRVSTGCCEHRAVRLVGTIISILGGRVRQSLSSISLSEERLSLLSATIPSFSGPARRTGAASI